MHTIGVVFTNKVPRQEGINWALFDGSTYIVIKLKTQIHIQNAGKISTWVYGLWKKYAPYNDSCTYSTTHNKLSIIKCHFMDYHAIFCRPVTVILRAQLSAEIRPFSIIKQKELWGLCPQHIPLEGSSSQNSVFVETVGNRCIIQKETCDPTDLVCLLRWCVFQQTAKRVTFYMISDPRQGAIWYLSDKIMFLCTTVYVRISVTQGFKKPCYYLFTLNLKCIIDKHRCIIDTHRN